MHHETTSGHWIEWATGVLSVLLVMSLISWIGWRALTGVDEPPLFEVKPHLSEAVHQDHRVDFTVTNQARQTAASVVIRGILSHGAVKLEEVDVTFDYIPGESEVRGAMIFRTDPTEASITMGVVSYREP
ncbi:hypothetical protein FE840_015480 [Peteryoungia desertarenae]|uniref:TIGR02588 family protein n=1 Tax=Peteryoungia desertarenae TaxID=1813451 RepID=A0ABX6QRL1_9HYPH|nr:hypothetical protein [Peteryoungia desertarenae]QLF70830.1 hypothetical protein FE840_015480 [Peteryoungia desertarenae]